MCATTTVSLIVKTMLPQGIKLATTAMALARLTQTTTTTLHRTRMMPACQGQAKV